MALAVHLLLIATTEKQVTGVNVVASKWPKKVLMVDPKNYRIEYAINPFMQNTQGALKTVNVEKALKQWDKLKSTFENLGLKVEVLEGSEQHPDMVFCANQTFPYQNHFGEANVVLANMKYDERKGEVQHFREWAQKNNINLQTVENVTFEGSGDALINYDTGEVFGGFGFRTDETAYHQLETLIRKPIHRLKLVNPEFYHLDTCLALINADTAAIVEEAFDKESLTFLRNKFTNIVKIPLNEARKQLAGNLTSIGGRTVIMNSGAIETKEQLEALGISVIEVDTSEFVKAGGSVFCMKQFYF